MLASEAYKPIINEMGRVYAEVEKCSSFGELVTFISLFVTNRLTATSYAFLQADHQNDRFFVLDHQGIPAELVERINSQTVVIRKIRVFRKIKGFSSLTTCVDDPLFASFLEKSGMQALQFNAVFPLCRGRKPIDGIILMQIGADQLSGNDEVQHQGQIFKILFSDLLYRFQEADSLRKNNLSMEASLSDLRVFFNVDDTLESFKRVKTQVLQTLDEVVAISGVSWAFISYRDPKSGKLNLSFVRGAKKKKLEDKINAALESEYEQSWTADLYQKVINKNQSIIIDDVVKQGLDLDAIHQVNQILNGSRAEPVQFVACYPIKNMDDGKIIGFINLVNNNKPFHAERQLQVQVKVQKISEYYLQLKVENKDVDEEEGQRIYTQAQFERLLDWEFQRFAKFQSDMTLLKIRIDRLDGYTESMAEPELMHIQKQLANYVREQFTALDIIGSHGEEFMAVLVGVESYKGMYVAEQVRKNIKKLRLENDKGIEYDFKLTATVGVVGASKEFDKLPALIEKVDQLIEGSSVADRVYFYLAGQNRQFVDEPFTLDEIGDLQVF